MEPVWSQIYFQHFSSLPKIFQALQSPWRKKQNFFFLGFWEEKKMLQSTAEALGKISRVLKLQNSPYHHLSITVPYICILKMGHHYVCPLFGASKQLILKD